MRRERSFLILLVLGLALGGYIYFVERHRPAADVPDTTPKVFEGVEASQIEELLVVGEERTRLKKSDAGWQIVEPIAVEADDGEVSSLASSLANLDRMEVVDENPGNLSEFGLDPPRGEVGFRTAGSTELRRLLLGNRAPTGTGMYAKLPDGPQVLLIPAHVETTFSRSTFDLRHKEVLKFDREKVDALAIASPERRVRLTRSAGEWKIAEPLEVRADFGTAEGLVGRLSTAQMRAVVSSDPPDAAGLRKFGLDRPSLTVTVGAGSTRASLEIGGKDADGNRYARDTSRPLVFAIDDTLVTELDKPIAQFRRKEVFEFRPFNANGLEIARDGQTVRFAKQQPAGEAAGSADAWRQTAPAERDIEIAKMDALLSALSNVRAETWQDPAARPQAGEPSLVVSVTFDTDRQERLRFWRMENEVRVAREDEPGAAIISTPDYDNIVRALDDVLE